jgi:hypothetical protein
MSTLSNSLFTQLTVSLGDKQACHAEGFGQCLGLLIDFFLQSSIEALQRQVTRREIFFF